MEYQPIKGNRCPFCTTILNPKNHRPMCVHVCWSKSHNSWVIAHRRKGKRIHKRSFAQEGKYSLVPQWRKKRNP